MTRRLASVAPREQVGAKTGDLYEFQYGEAALACLELLASGTDACVYCEWHDDYVIERGRSVPTYEFFQVKSRSTKQGPWPMSEILGVVGRRPRTAQTSGPNSAEAATRKAKARSKAAASLKPAAAPGIAERLLEHQRTFPGACAAFAIVSTHEATDDAFLALIEGAAAVRHRPGAGPALLPRDAQALLSEIVSAYQQRDPTVTPQDVWELIARLRIQRAAGRPGEVDVVIGLMVQRIYDLSEVDLHTSEQRRVAKQLIDRVRAKSHCTVDPTAIPGEAEVRASKAIDIDEVLSLLALSPAGYRELRRGGKADVRAYSRLHRLCRENGMDQQMIALACKLRVQWDVWLSENRDSLTTDLELVVWGHARSLLKQIRASTAGLTMAEIRREAEATAQVLNSMGGLPELDASAVMGLVFAMASEAADG